MLRKWTNTLEGICIIYYCTWLITTSWLFWLCVLPSSALAMYVLALVPVKHCWRWKYSCWSVGIGSLGEGGWAVQQAGALGSLVTAQLYQLQSEGLLSPFWGGQQGVVNVSDFVWWSSDSRSKAWFSSIRLPAGTQASCLCRSAGVWSGEVQSNCLKGGGGSCLTQTVLTPWACIACHAATCLPHALCRLTARCCSKTMQHHLPSCLCSQGGTGNPLYLFQGPPDILCEWSTYPIWQFLHK